MRRIEYAASFETYQFHLDVGLSHAGIFEGPVAHKRDIEAAFRRKFGGLVLVSVGGGWWVNRLIVSRRIARRREEVR